MFEVEVKDQQEYLKKMFEHFYQKYTDWPSSMRKVLESILYVYGKIIIKTLKKN